MILVVYTLGPACPAWTLLPSIDSKDWFMSLEAVFSGASAIAGFGERFELGRRSMEASMQGTTFLPLSDHFMAVDIAEESICKQADGSPDMPI